jgi:hypothetical protein
MNNTAIVHNRRRKIGGQEKNLEMVALESTHSATNETAFILSDTEKTFQTETRSKSYGVDKAFSRYVSSLVSFFGRIVSTLNGFGGSKVDVHRMESRHKEQLGPRRWNL